VFTGLESPSKLLLLLVAAVVLFGAKRLPEIGRSLGHGMRGFKDALSGDEEPPVAAGEPLSAGSPAEHDTTG
jgi:sec-independent protein translocase protein TatA